MGARTWHEPAREIPVADEVDVVVCGGGPAGTVAAIAAGRSGASVRLIESQGSLGGMWTTGCLGWIIDAANKPGLMGEITTELDRRGASLSSVAEGGSYAYDIETLRLILEQMCLEAGVRVQLYSRVVSAGLNDRQLAVAVTESKSGRQAWAGRTFIDATGDGDLAALAGCGFDVGEPGSGKMQPMTLIAMLTGLRFEEVEPFIAGGVAEPKRRLGELLRQAGVAPSYSCPGIFHLGEHLYVFSGTHAYGASGMDAGDLTAATVSQRREVHRLMDALRGLGGPWANLRVVATADSIGVREGRRVHGHYTVTLDDMINGARHDDAICRVTFGLDVHSMDPARGQNVDPGYSRKTQPYDIPLRALLSRDVPNLLLAGRCISGDFAAHSSYRVTGNCAAMGQAAGATAALAAETGMLPRELPWERIRERLPTMGSDLH